MDIMSGFYWDTGSKEHNQDSVLLEQVNTGKGRILLAAVSDGIGGLPEGEVASGFLMERSGRAGTDRVSDEALQDACMRQQKC